MTPDFQIGDKFKSDGRWWTVVQVQPQQGYDSQALLVQQAEQGDAALLLDCRIWLAQLVTGRTQDARCRAALHLLDLLAERLDDQPGEGLFAELAATVTQLPQAAI